MRAAIYARISKDTEGTELGVTRQQDDCRREAERRGWQVVETYVDNDVSATKSKARPQYQRMIRDVKSGHIDAILVWAVDRLTRSPRELEDVIDLADRYGLSLANVNGTIQLDTPEGRAMARQMGTFARLEVENMSKRLRRKFEEKASKGEPHGYSPYGYVRVDGRDVIDIEKAEVVREAARRVLAHDSLRSIANDFNARGIHGPKAEKWNSTILRQILLRPAYAGLRQYRGAVVGPSTSEPVYSQDTFNRLSSLLRDASRRSNHVGPGFKYLLSGLAICGKCGGSMRRQIGRTVVSLRTGAEKRQPPSYGCSQCYRVRRAQEPVDQIVSEVIVTRLSLPDALDLFARSDSEAAKEAQDTIAAIDAKLDAAADQFSDDAITATQLKRISAKLRDTRARAEARLKATRPNSALATLTIGDVRTNWDAMSIGARREVVEALLTVTIHPAGSGKRFDPDTVGIEWLR